MANIDRQRLDQVTDLINQEARRTNRTTAEIILAIKKITKREVSLSELQSLIDIELNTIAPASTANQSLRLQTSQSPPSSSSDKLEDTLVQDTQISISDTLPLSRSVNSQTQTNSLTKKELLKLKKVLNADELDELFYSFSPDTIRSLTGSNSVSRSQLIKDLDENKLMGFLKTLEKKDIKKLRKKIESSSLEPDTVIGDIPKQITPFRGHQATWHNNTIITDSITVELGHKVLPSSAHLPNGVDLSTPIKITYPEVEIDFDLVQSNFSYLKSEEYINKFGENFATVPRNKNRVKDIGTSIGSGASKGAYLSKDGQYVIKTFMPITENNGVSLKRAQENLANGIRRELAIEDFLIEIEQRYITAGESPPFRVLRINRDPDLLKRGIIVQEVSSGKSLGSISRKEFEQIVPKRPHHITLSEEVLGSTQKHPLHEELVDRIPRAKEMMAVFERFEESIHKHNKQYYHGQKIGGYIPHLDSQGNLIKDFSKAIRYMPVDYGIRFKNLGYNPNKVPPFEFFDW